MDTAAASDIQLIEENKRLRSALEELSILNEITTAITSTQPIETIVELIVQKCVKHLSVEQGAVMLLDEKDKEKPFHTMIRNQDSYPGILPFRLDAQLNGWMLKNKTALLINDLPSDNRFNFLLENNFPIKSLLSVPLTVKGKMIGLLSVFNKKTTPGFSKDDQRLLGIIAAQSGQLIENARLYREEQALLLLQEEMRLAFEIQTDLLPKILPDIPGLQIAGKSLPAKEVGGDYYDFIRVDDSHTAFCIADISGKGIPAALLMANLQATLRGQTMLNRSCNECVAFANEILFHNTAPNRFATLFYGIIDSKLNQITYCNAGHNNPYLVLGDNSIKELNTGGLIIGIMPSIQYAEDIINLNSGDLLVLYSDGITEAMNTNEEEYGEQRFKELLIQNKNESASQLIKIIFDEVKVFTRGAVQSDDITAVVIKKL